MPLPTLPKMYTPLGGRGGLGGAPTASANWACCARALATAAPAAPWSEAGWVASCALSQPTRVCALLGAFLLWAASSCRRAFACLQASCKQPELCRQKVPHLAKCKHYPVEYTSLDQSHAIADGVARMRLCKGMTWRSNEELLFLHLLQGTGQMLTARPSCPQPFNCLSVACNGQTFCRHNTQVDIWEAAGSVACSQSLPCTSPEFRVELADPGTYLVCTHVLFKHGHCRGVLHQLIAQATEALHALALIAVREEDAGVERRFIPLVQCSCPSHRTPFNPVPQRNCRRRRGVRKTPAFLPARGLGPGAAP